MLSNIVDARLCLNYVNKIIVVIDVTIDSAYIISLHTFKELKDIRNEIDSEFIHPENTEILMYMH